MDDQARDTVMSAPGDVDPANGGHLPGDDRVGQQAAESADYARGGSAAGDGVDAVSGSKSDSGYRGEKQVKPNKVYIGGLPEHTRKEDLESCFGKIGNIVNIELKVGYGFVEFDNREAAEESVAKYHEGYFMGNKIRVELSHGGGRTAKYSGDPGACFKCGQMGHWARECPNHMPNGHRRPGHHSSDAPLIDRIQPHRDYPPPPPRDYPSYRDDYARYPPPRDVRYGYEYPPPPPGRDYRRPPSPSREFRDYPPPPVRSARDYDDYRMRGPPPPPLPPPRYESRAGYYPPEGDAPPPGYPPRSYPPPRDYYDRYDRRPGPPPDRYSTYPPPAAAVRTRSPPPSAPPPRVRDDFDRPPARDYVPPSEVRGRPITPPPTASRYVDYPPRAGSSEAPPARYRRRSQSPPPRSASGGYDSAAYQAGSGGAPYNGGSSGNYAGNGYSGGGAGAVPSRSAGRDYPPRSTRDSGEPGGSYRRP
ncbi:hypothetical protein AcW1_000285 [Taiwanofungus camphoratus]|nr:hypothetical protein AcW2_001219 [Antrodia cinnamomea]KAI0935894.1 hypothetical protein AcV5_004186 [Antrodia cinnamomea]KAI0963111.1 hypothetical protein AcW1_000285 [Antrodia cinnamomea]